MKTIFVNGCFDILHRGHIELFSYARSLGDFLWVAIDSDENIRKAKGPDRPVTSEVDRAFILKSIRHINDVVIFKDSIELRSFLKIIRPDIMVVGSDWKNKEIVGSELSKEVRYFDRIEPYSSTKIIES